MKTRAPRKSALSVSSHSARGKTVDTLRHFESPKMVLASSQEPSDRPRINRDNIVSETRGLSSGEKREIARKRKRNRLRVSRVVRKMRDSGSWNARETRESP